MLEGENGVSEMDANMFSSDDEMLIMIERMHELYFSCIFNIPICIQKQSVPKKMSNYANINACVIHPRGLVLYSSYFKDFYFLFFMMRF